MHKNLVFSFFIPVIIEPILLFYMLLDMHLLLTLLRKKEIKNLFYSMNNAMYTPQRGIHGLTRQCVNDYVHVALFLFLFSSSF